MTYHVDDTIAAIASAPGGALRGVVRASGPRLRECLLAIGVSHEVLQAIEQTGLAVESSQLTINERLSDVPVDLHYWPGTRSYTRQPTAELHTIGSRPILEAVLKRLCESGARLAEPGEFTLRAFLAGRLDLLQAEGVLGAIDAADRRQLDAALGQLAGGLSTPLVQLRSMLLELLAHLEAGLDFVEDDIEFISPGELRNQVNAAQEQMAMIADRLRDRDRSDRLPRVVIMGEPNVGKSSLLNALAGDGVAIVSGKAGTTRDYVTRRVHWFGRDLVIVDTAGWEDSTANNPLTGSAQHASGQQVKQADLRVLCLDSSRQLTERERRRIDSPIGEAPRIIVATKVDQRLLGMADDCQVATSSVTGEGVEALRREIVNALEADEAADAHVVTGTARRCQQTFRQAADALGRASSTIQENGGDEVTAAELRSALDALGQIVGAVYTDDILDQIFSRFCIGK